MKTSQRPPSIIQGHIQRILRGWGCLHVPDLPPPPHNSGQALLNTGKYRRDTAEKVMCEGRTRNTYHLRSRVQYAERFWWGLQRFLNAFICLFPAATSLLGVLLAILLLSGLGLEIRLEVDIRQSPFPVAEAFQHCPWQLLGTTTKYLTARALMV